MPGLLPCNTFVPSLILNKTIYRSYIHAFLSTKRILATYASKNESLDDNYKFYSSKVRTMTDEGKTKGRLIEELNDLRQRVAELEKKEADHKQMQEKLRESEERFRAFMDNNPAAIYIKDETDRHIYGNPPAFASVVKKPDEFIGSTTRDFFSPEVADMLIELDRKVLKENIIRITEEWRDSASGDVCWYRDIKFPIKLGPGKKLLGGIAIDITEIKQSEQRLQNAYREIERLNQKLKQENIYLREEISLQHPHHDIVGQSDSMKRVLSEAEQVAETDSTILILGETGTGKELLAHAIHNMSSRKGRPMLTLNCSALPGTLIESELFGREKGAYTGALTKQVGRFELADGSTIFLDEISELPLDLQTKLLRVLEDSTFERLGSSETIKVDIRVIAATNRDLAKDVSQGRFREDLYYRLNVFPVTLPPLRERREDIPLLVWTFVKEYSETMGKTIDSIPRETMESLQRYPWPGNVRELKNVVERAMILSKGFSLHIEVPGVSESARPRSTMTLEELEKRHITNVLETTGWRVRGKNGAAEILGLKPSTLESRMAKRGIRRKR
jgi:PAS domain S-box-containing protein